jgi:hypothetical protein
MGEPWKAFLEGSGQAAHHGVQLYEDVDELAVSVAAFFVAGFEAGEPAVMVTVPEHAAVFGEAFAESGWDAARLDRERLLATVDAESALVAIMQGSDHPSPRALEEVVGGAFDRFPRRHVRAFGELVDLLVGRAKTKAALELEQLWNDLARRRSFALLCGYRLDVFDREVQTVTLRPICREHSHVLPAADPARLARAVDGALEEVLGAAEAGKVYVVVGPELRSGRIPGGQVVLMWISEHMPALADRVLASARARYLADDSLAA